MCFFYWKNNIVCVLYKHRQISTILHAFIQLFGCGDINAEIYLSLRETFNLLIYMYVGSAFWLFSVITLNTYTLEPDTIVVLSCGRWFQCGSSPTPPARWPTTWWCTDVARRAPTCPCGHAHRWTTDQTSNSPFNIMYQNIKLRTHVPNSIFFYSKRPFCTKHTLITDSDTHEYVFL